MSNGRYLKQSLNLHGYAKVCLIQDTKRVNVYIHRIVAELYVANPKGLGTVNHINGLKSDNDSSNLEWLTHKDNMRHAFDTGLIKNRGSANKSTKLTEDQVFKIREQFYEQGATCRGLATTHRMSVGAIQNIVTYKTWQHVEFKSTWIKQPKYNNKLTKIQVDVIRDEYKSGSSLSQLAKIHRVSRSTIHKVVTYKTWK